MPLLQSYLEINHSQQKIPFSTVEVFSFFYKVFPSFRWFRYVKTADAGRDTWGQIPKVQADRIKLLLCRESRAAPFSVQNFRHFLCSACFVLVGDQLRINPSFTAEGGEQSVHG